MEKGGSKAVVLGKREGFTLAEMIVAIGLYSVLVSVAVGGFANAMRTQRQTAAIMAANTTASLLQEQIAREVRTGRIFTITSQGGLAFTNARKQSVEYYNDQTTGMLMKSINGTSLPLTPASVKVLRFWVNPAKIGWLAGDNYPPRVTFVLSLSPRVLEKNMQAVTIQSTVSARNIDT